MRIALASPRVAISMEDGLAKVERLIAKAADHGAKIVCFPEAYLPGLRGVGIDVLTFGLQEHAYLLEVVCRLAKTYSVVTIFGTERLTENGRQIASYVIADNGQVLGIQTKNQIDPSEDPFYVAGNTRQIFEFNGLKFGICICHEGWRYPETVRWAAIRGAKVVFHPQHTGSDENGVCLTKWGESGAPYYEKAMMMRSRENTIYFASVNYALQFQESATSLIHPSGECQAFLPYGEEGLLVQDLQLEEATGLLALRFAPERYRETTTGYS